MSTDRREFLGLLAGVGMTGAVGRFGGKTVDSVPPSRPPALPPPALPRYRPTALLFPESASTQIPPSTSTEAIVFFPGTVSRASCGFFSHTAGV